MDIKGWIAPQEKQFFDDLEGEAENVLDGARALESMLGDFENLPAHQKRIKEIEHRGDEIVHHIYESLNRAFVTPLAKEDLGGLASRMDDVLDLTHAAATRIAIYEIESPTPPMVEFAKIILQAVEQLQQATQAIRERESTDRVLRATIEVNRLENLGDEVLLRALADLLKDADPIRIIKLKEIYETLETVMDRCEDVANILEDIVVKAR